MKNIVFISDIKDFKYTVDKFYAGGSEKQILSLANFLVENKFNARVFGYSNESKNIIRFKVFITLVKYAPFFTRFLEAFIKLSKMKESIFIHKIPSPMSIFYLVVSRLNNSKFVIVNSSDRLLTDVYYKKFNVIKRWMLKFALKHTDLMISQNNLQREQYENQYGKHSVVIYNMIDSIPDIDIREYKKDYFLWVGRNLSVKRFELYVEMARRLKEAKFIAITNADISDVPDNLEILPLMKRENLYEYYRGSIVLVNTSEWEGFPNVYLESWANGSGVVTLRIDPDNIIERNNIGYVCGDDMDIMEDKLRELWMKRKDAYKLGERAREYVINNHSANVIGQRWIKVIESL